jgi:DNA-directed RNA polymerase specialized sigma24 family protein
MVGENVQYRSAATLAQEILPTPAECPSGPTNAPAGRDSLRSAFLCLPAQDRQFLLMHYADGLTLREIGCVLNISEATAGLLHEALIADFVKRQERV